MEPVKKNYEHASGGAKEGYKNWAADMTNSALLENLSTSITAMIWRMDYGHHRRMNKH